MIPLTGILSSAFDITTEATNGENFIVEALAVTQLFRTPVRYRVIFCDHIQRRHFRCLRRIIHPKSAPEFKSAQEGLKPHLTRYPQIDSILGSVSYNTRTPLPIPWNLPFSLFRTHTASNKGTIIPCHTQVELGTGLNRVLLFRPFRLLEPARDFPCA